MNKCQPPASTIPQQIGKFRITGKVGRGGMGDIYKAVEESLGRVVALKVLPPQLSRDQEFAARFETEARAISHLQHQNIVSIYHYGDEDGYRFFAMQYVDGKNLAEHIDCSRQLEFSDIIDIAKQICRGLRYAHCKGIIHRDIKPQNILIDQSGTVRITDFGIARIFNQQSITLTGVTVGTPEYMSPEQAEGIELDVRTDIYSLGILMYEMLTKKPPFTGNNPVAIAYKQVHEVPPPPSHKRAHIPPRLELIVLKALKKEKKERYQSVEEMLEHLDSVDTNESHDRPTTRIATLETESAAREKSADLRITDRRSGDRRYRLHDYQNNGRLHLVICIVRSAIEQQALSLVLIALLGAVVVYHLVTQ